MTRLVLLLAGALALAPATLLSQEKEPGNPEVVSVKLNGVHVVQQGELRQSIHTTASHCNSFILKPFCWISKANIFYTEKHLDRGELQRDPLRIRVFYWKRGYREATVDTIVAPAGRNKVAVTFSIKEGPPTIVSNVIVNQATELLTPREIGRRVVIGPKGPLNMIRLDSSRVFLMQSLWERGYADAEVDTSIVIDPATRTAVVSFTLNPRYLTTIEDIVVDGNEGVSDSTVMKSLTLRVGNIFRRSDMLRSQRALYESNLFRRAAIEPRPPLDVSTPDSAKVIVVTVQESPPREVRYSAGFNTVDFAPVVPLRRRPTASASSARSTSSTLPESTRSSGPNFHPDARDGRRAGVSRHGSRDTIRSGTSGRLAAARAIRTSCTIVGQTVVQWPKAKMRSTGRPGKSSSEVRRPRWSVRTKAGAATSTRVGVPGDDAGGAVPSPVADASRWPSAASPTRLTAPAPTIANRQRRSARIRRRSSRSAPPQTASRTPSIPIGSPISRIHPPASGNPPGADPKQTARVRSSHAGSTAPAGQSASAHHAAVIARISSSASEAAPGRPVRGWVIRSSTGS